MLKGLMISKKIEQRKADLAVLAEQETALKTREAELEAAIDEAKTDEELAVVEENSNKIDGEKKELGEKKSKLEGEIAALEGELQQLNSKDPSKNSPPASGQERGFQIQLQGGEARMKRGFFRDMVRGEVDALINRSEVKDFLQRVRELGGEKRAVTGAELGIPEIMLDLLRDNLHRYSKLITKVRLKPLKGKARQNITGAIPEGIWTEAVGELNELSLSFTQMELDGYKVGGFIPIPNPTLEDSDFNLASEVMDALGQAIGYAVDKAVVYGTGIKMPVGIVTRLAQESAPSNWGANAPTWTDLHSTNLVNINPASYTTAQTYFAALILKLSIAKPNYSDGAPVWIMNRITHMTLLSKCLEFNASAALVAGMNNTMPVIGGEIVELEFMSDNDIVGGFGSLYLLVERAGSSLAASEHVRFIQDQTVFKGTARYDGAPIFGEGFVGVNINNSSVTTSKSFAADAANTVATPKALPIAGIYTGAQSVALTCDTPGASIYYTVDGSTPDATKTAYNGPIAVAATTTIKAIAIKTGMTNSAVFSGTYTISGG